MICMFCNRAFEKIDQIKNHLNEDNLCNVLKRIKYTCINCDFTTSNFCDMRIHTEKCYIPNKIQTNVIKEVVDDNVIKDKESNEVISKEIPEDENTDDKQQEIIIKKRKSKKRINISKKEVKKSRSPKKTKQKEKKTFEEYTIRELVKFMNDKYESLKNTQRYTTILNDIKQARHCILKKGDVNLYKEIVLKSMKKFSKIMDYKKFTDAKKNKLILKHFTSLDLRLILHPNCEKSPPDGMILSDLNHILKNRKKVTISNFNTFFTTLANDSIIYFDIKTILERDIPMLGNVFCYFGDNYKFYKLDNIENDINYWIQDSYARNFTIDLSKVLVEYYSSIFKKIYYFIFKDYVFRRDLIKKSEGFSNELRNILNALIFISNEKKFNDFICEILRNLCPREKTDYDDFNLSNSDPITEELKDDCKNTLKSLFENTNDADDIFIEDIEL